MLDRDVQQFADVAQAFHRNSRAFRDVEPAVVGVAGDVALMFGQVLDVALEFNDGLAQVTSLTDVILVRLV